MEIIGSTVKSKATGKEFRIIEIVGKKLKVADYSEKGLTVDPCFFDIDPELENEIKQFMSESKSRKSKVSSKTSKVSKPGNC